MKSHYHCVYKLKYHLVLVTQYRRPSLTQTMLQRLETICHDLLQQWQAALEEFRGEADHVHLILDMHPHTMQQPQNRNQSSTTQEVC